MTVGEGHHMLFFILGAPDPEMQAIEALLRACGVEYGYATSDGTRVHPGNAYRATAVMPPCSVRPGMPCAIDPHPAIGDTPGDTYCPHCGRHDPAAVNWLLDEYRVVVVECAVAGLTPWQVCDHHRAGDPGYGRPPEEFLPASSIGQVISLLADSGRLPQEWTRRFVSGSYYISRGDSIANTVRIVSGQDGGHLDEPSYPGEVALIPEDIILIAASDHCLGAAYQGLCPGVDPNALMAWRVEQRALFRHRTVDSLMVEINNARSALLAKLKAAQDSWDDHADRKYGYDWFADRVPLGLYEDCVADIGERPRKETFIADFGDTTVAELPEAACREGIAFIATVTERDGRRKRVLQAATPAQVQAWMAGEGAILTGLYGDPARGFAGGYLPTDDGY